MNARATFTLITLFAVLISFSGCRRSSNDIWEDTKTGSRHINRGVKSFGGKCGDSRAICNPADFQGPMDDVQWASNSSSNVSQDFVPLSDQPRSDEIAMAEYVSRQPTETPGDPGSSVPGIDSFRDPATLPEVSGIFRNISFDYNSYLVKGQSNFDTLRDISDYMRGHPNTYIFVEGHCDERGPEAFNLALGARRANAVRNELLQNGVNADNVFTISYGKERPLVMEQHEEAWSKNRRAEFKIYMK